MAYNATLEPVDAFAVTTSDSAAISACGFYVGGTGDVTVTTIRGNDVTFKAVPVGTTIMLAVSKIKATGTTATNIVGLRVS